MVHLFVDTKLFVSVSYCIVCAYVREDNPPALASGLYPVYAHNHTTPYCTSMHVHFVHCEISDDTQRCNNVI